MSKHEIEVEVEGLPEGYVPVAFRLPLKTEKYFFDGEIHTAFENMAYEYLIVKKKQPRRIVLEETEEDNKKYRTGVFEQQFVGGGIILHNRSKKWREVKETEETNLCLSVEECEEIVYNDYSIPVDLSVKIDNFLSAINKTS